MGALDFALALDGRNLVNRILLEFDPKLNNTLWVTMKKDVTGGAHNFSLPLLRDLRLMIEDFQHSGARYSNDGNLVPVRYAVLKSDHPDYFSQGGDLNHFRECISKNDRDALHNYAKTCLDILTDWAATFAGTTTIALVQGRALGGGFETALNADFLIAEEHSTFSFPEIMFGLFPCTGGMNLLARRVGVIQAERMMSDNRIYKAAELKEMGVVDEICPRGEGVLAVEKFIAAHSKRRVAREALQRCRHRLAPLDYSEMLTLVDEWVEAAMELGQEELNVMDMLITMQRGRKSVRSNIQLV